MDYRQYSCYTLIIRSANLLAKQTCAT
ncbi:unnamed protein product, partial [Allacma fusca]